MKTSILFFLAAIAVASVNCGFIPRQPHILFQRSPLVDDQAMAFALSHSGQCPRIPRGTSGALSIGICIDNCVSDNDCQGGERCCGNGCANRCTGPERVRGDCPMPQEIPPSFCLNCPNCACNADNQCNLGKKCCLSSCGHSVCI